MSIQTTTGSRIRHSRNQVGLSVQQLACRIGVQRKTMESWESNRTEPRGEKLVKLAGVLQVPMVWLITGDTPQSMSHDPKIPETLSISQKLDRALAMQQELAAILTDVSGEITRLQRELNDEQDIAA